MAATNSSNNRPEPWKQENRTQIARVACVLAHASRAWARRIAVHGVSVLPDAPTKGVLAVGFSPDDKYILMTNVFYLT